MHLSVQKCGKRTNSGHSGIAAVGAAFWKKSPNHRPFSPVDPDISFPYVEHEKVSTAVLIVVSVVAPAVITAGVALTLTPRSGLAPGTSSARLWRRKLWEWNTAWMGLALGLALTFLFTEGIKVLIGRPRPDLLSRCDLDPAKVSQFALGGYGSRLPQFNLLVSYTACRQTDQSKLDDGFQSFPSGHSSFSWAGMFYLALFLCSKFAIRIPRLFFSQRSDVDASVAGRSISNGQQPRDGSTPTLTYTRDDPKDTSIREQGAAPPAYLFVLPIIPIAAATYIAGSRFSDFRHHGFDIIFGALMGIIFSFIGFRMYQLPIRQGIGWSWGPRSASNAWWLGMGKASYASKRLDEEEKKDLETGNKRVGSRGKSSDEPTTSDNSRN